MNKEYKSNIKLKQYLENHISTMKVPDEFKPILVDILMRRAYEFKLSPEEITQDVTSLLRNLKKIKIDKMPKGYEFAAGLYVGMKKTIIINSKVMEDMMKKGDTDTLYEILTHEVFHALSRDERGRDTLASINVHSKKYNSTLLETIVEKAADRCVFSRNDDTTAPYYHKNEYGYNDITFITDALAATYGLTEESFLKCAILGRQNLISMLSSFTGESKKDTISFLDMVEVHFAKIHKALYGKDSEEKSVSTDDLAESMSMIYKLCEAKMNVRMENFEVSDLEAAKFFGNYMKYNHNKLNFVMEDATNELGIRFGLNFKDTVNKGAKLAKSFTLSRINYFCQLTENADKLASEQRAVELINLAKKGKLSEADKQEIADAGIEIKDEKTFSIDSEFIKKRIQADFSSYTWNNDDVAAMFESVMVKLPKRKISSFVKTCIGKMRFWIGSSSMYGKINTLIHQNRRQTSMLGEGTLCSRDTRDPFKKLSPEEVNAIHERALSTESKNESRPEAYKDGIHL